jgi:hypothetical protein
MPLLMISAHHMCFIYTQTLLYECKLMSLFGAFQQSVMLYNIGDILNKLSQLLLIFIVAEAELAYTYQYYKVKYSCKID